MQGSQAAPGSAAKGKGKGKEDRKSAKGGKGAKGAPKTPEPPSGKNPSKLKKRGEIDENELYIGSFFLSNNSNCFQVIQ